MGEPTPIIRLPMRKQGSALAKARAPVLRNRRQTEKGIARGLFAGLFGGLAFEVASL